jgi:glycosyltransferase involved in cell wall biosynthesis
MSNSEIDFSIITVSYNSDKTLERTIRSVLDQTHKNYEYILVDGGSSDNTNAIIESYKTKFTTNFVHISEPDNGIYDAMNKGIALAKGKVVGLLNSDDYYFNNTLSTVFEIFKNTDKKSVISGELLFKSITGEQLLKTSEVRFKKIMKKYKNGVRHPATFVPKVIYDELGLFNLNYKIASDAELIFRIYRAEFDFIFVNQPLVVMSDGGISNSKGIFKQLILENHYLLKTYCPSFILRCYFMMLTIVRLGVKEIFGGVTSVYRKMDNH